MTFTDYEIKALSAHPAVLRALADLHGVWSMDASSVDSEFFAGCVAHHDARAAELRRAAEAIEATY